MIRDPASGLAAVPAMLPPVCGNACVHSQRGCTTLLPDRSRAPSGHASRLGRLSPDWWPGRC
ncbi:MAG: hypothetical protein QOE58_724 [Actinomycetota bacterium]|nr:hypothetical protein [Actinomycetota bacterium]